MDALRSSGDSVGARLRVIASGVPVGLGAPLYDKLDADIAYAMMGINAVKGVEIGAGFNAVTQKGSEHGDELLPDGFATNHAGGVLGGISTGQDIEVSIAIKPTSSIRLPRRSIDRAGEADRGRDARPPRSLRRHPRHADRRGDAGAGADRPRAAASRAERRRAARRSADPGGLALPLMSRRVGGSRPRWSAAGDVLRRVLRAGRDPRAVHAAVLRAPRPDRRADRPAGGDGAGDADGRAEPVGLARRPLGPPHAHPARHVARARRVVRAALLPRRLRLRVRA